MRQVSGGVRAALAILALTALLAVLNIRSGFDLRSGLGAYALVAACIVAAVCLVRSLGPPPPQRGWLLLAFGVVIILVVVLAFVATTAHSVNPDEANHVAAALYYAGRWLPPAVGDPASLPSYSEYGASYLNELDIVYLLAAKFAAALSFTGLDATIRLRLFNVSLLGLCVASAVRSRSASLVMLAMLCSGQAWYVFGYFNSDAIALASALLLAVALATSLDRANESSSAVGATQWRWAITLGVLIGLCLLSKRTLYPFLPFIVAYGAWRSGLRTASAYQLGAMGLALLGLWFYVRPPIPGVRALIPPSGPRLMMGLVALLFLAWAAWIAIRSRPAGFAPPRTLLTAIAIGIGIFAVRVAVDVGINGLPGHKALAMRDLAEHIAAPIFRPSVAASPKGYLGIALAAKGLSLGDMLFGRFGWAKFVVASFFGLYGYLNIFAPLWMYHAQLAVAIVLAGALAVPLARRPSSRLALGIAVAGALLTIELAVLNSWVLDFQPQGRYVFALLPIAGVLMLQRGIDGQADLSDRWADRISRGCIGALWLLAALSFALVALPGLAHA